MAYRDEEQSYIEQKLEELIQKRRNTCLSMFYFNNYLLKKGDIIRLKIKGRGKDEIMAVFECYNPYYNWMRLVIEDEIIMVKLSEVRYIAVERKRRRKDEEANM